MESQQIEAELPVVMIADLIAAGLQSGCMVLRRPAMPETWGHDIEVPDIMLKERGRWSISRDKRLGAFV